LLAAENISLLNGSGDANGGGACVWLLVPLVL